MATQVQRLEIGQLLLPVDGGDESRRPTTETDKHSEEQVAIIDEQNAYKQTSARLDVGKQPLPNFDPWQFDDIKGQTDMMLRTERVRVLQFETELGRMQKTIEEFQHKSDPQPIPIRRTPNVTHNLAQQQHDKMALLLAAIGFVRPLVKYGRPYAEALFNKFFGNKDINMEEVFANVDWPVLQAETPTEGSSGSRRGWRRALGLDEVQLTPQQQQQQQQQHAQVHEQERQQPQ